MCYRCRPPHYFDSSYCRKLYWDNLPYGGHPNYSSPNPTGEYRAEPWSYNPIWKEYVDTSKPTVFTPPKRNNR